MGRRRARTRGRPRNEQTKLSRWIEQAYRDCLGVMRTAERYGARRKRPGLLEELALARASSVYASLLGKRFRIDVRITTEQ